MKIHNKKDHLTINKRRNMNDNKNLPIREKKKSHVSNMRKLFTTDKK